VLVSKSEFNTSFMKLVNHYILVMYVVFVICKHIHILIILYV